MRGWISLHRKIFDHPFYKERREFSHYEAWIDLLLLASHEDHEFLLGDEMVQAHRGEIITSEVALMERWRWSKGKVRWFLNRLEKDRSTDRTTYPRKTKLFIKNYSTYQDSQTPNRPINRPINRPEKDTYNKGIKNKGNKTTKTIVPPPDFDVSKYRFFKGCDRTKVYNLLKEWNLLDTEEQPRSQPADIYEGHLFGTMDLKERSEWLIDSWNSLCGSKDVGLPKVTLTSERMATIKAKLDEVPDFLYEWINVMGFIMNGSPFLKGDNSQGFKATFDWVLEGDHWQKIIENQFEDPEEALESLTGDASEGEEVWF